MVLHSCEQPRLLLLLLLPHSILEGLPAWLVGTNSFSLLLPALLPLLAVPLLLSTGCSSPLVALCSLLPASPRDCEAGHLLPRPSQGKAAAGRREPAALPSLAVVVVLLLLHGAGSMCGSR